MAYMTAKVQIYNTTRQGKRDATRQLLGEEYGWFTEGFDTTDLQEARVLLEALS